MAEHIHRWLIWHGGILLISNLNETNGCMIKVLEQNPFISGTQCKLVLKYLHYAPYGVLSLLIEEVCIIDKSLL